MILSVEDLTGITTIVDQFISNAGNKSPGIRKVIFAIFVGIVLPRREDDVAIGRGCLTSRSLSRVMNSTSMG